MMIDIIKKFVKYGIFESTTDNYDYAIVTHDFSLTVAKLFVNLKLPAMVLMLITILRLWKS